MSIFEAIVQGIVQGLTEFLPVSSSGHLALSQHILGVQGNNLFFNVMLHLGTLAAVLAVYYKLVLRLIAAFFAMVKDGFSGKFKLSRLDKDEKLVVALIAGLLPLFVLFVPIPGTGMNLKDVAENWANNGQIMIVGFSLIATSILLAVGIRLGENATKTTKSAKYIKLLSGKREISIPDALCVGFTQCAAAIFPGLSRSGSTLAVGLLRGINKQAALDYSFVLGIPSILAAALLEFKDALEMGSMDIAFLPVVVGMVVSAIVGFLAIKLFKWLLATNKMSVFVWYTLILGVATIVISLVEKSKGVNIFTGAGI